MTNRFHPLVLATLIACAPALSRADTLDDLLSPKTDVSSLRDRDAAKAWNEVVDAFRRNDMASAASLGQKFLEQDFKATPYQVLGVKIMINLADEKAQVTSSNKDSKGSLDIIMAERAQITAKYQALLETIRAADAVIDRLTYRRTQPVQEGTAAYRECVRNASIIERANAELEILKPQIERNKQAALEVNSKLTTETKSDILRLLDMLLEADELEAAFAITNVYLRKAGEDLDVAKRQQDVIRLREVHEKAVKIAAAIHEQQRPLLSGKKYWAARDTREKSLEKVRQQAGDEDLIRMVVRRVSLDEAGVDSAISRAESETKVLLELAAVDPKKAEAQLAMLAAEYPDHPELSTLRTRISISDSVAMKGKMSDLLASIEALAESDPDQALTLLAGIREDQMDDIERASISARIAAAANKAITSCLSRAEKSLEEVKAKVGGEVAEVVAAEMAKVRNQDGDFVELTSSGIIRARIDRSADLPEAKATLEGVSRSLTLISAQRTSTQQRITLEALRTETRLLLAALK